MIGSCHHDSLHALTPIKVRHANHCRFHHTIMCHQHRLDAQWVDEFAAGKNDVICTPFYPDDASICVSTIIAHHGSTSDGSVSGVSKRPVANFSVSTLRAAR